MTNTTLRLRRLTEKEGGEEGFYLLGEVAESGSPFKRWVDVGAGFLKKKKLNSSVCKILL